MRITLEGFVTQELIEVQVRLDRMSQLQVTLPLARFVDEVVVTETTPVVDPEQVFINEWVRELLPLGESTRLPPSDSDQVTLTK